MEVVNPCAALLSNYEVYKILKETRSVFYFLILDIISLSYLKQLKLLILKPQRQKS